MYTPNLHIKKAVTPEKTMGYGFKPLEKILFYDKLTLAGIVPKGCNINIFQLLHIIGVLSVEVSVCTPWMSLTKCQVFDT